MRIVTTLLLVFSLALTACDKLGSGSDQGSSSPTSPSGPPTAGATIVYGAVGASDVLGIGSSKPCSLFEDCDGAGYVWVAARALRSRGFTVEVAQLGIPAGVISPTFQNLGIQYGRTIGGNFLQSEMPFVRRDAGLVTVFAGANDVNIISAALGSGAGGANPSAYIDQMVTTFGTDFATLISGIRARAKSARIIVLNLPNLAALPYLSGASLAQKQAAQRASVGITTTVINPTSGTTVIDLMCDPRLYQAAIFSGDGFHPNDAGYALLGAEIVTALTSSSYPPPRSSCSQMAIF